MRQVRAEWGRGTYQEEEDIIFFAQYIHKAYISDRRFSYDLSPFWLLYLLSNQSENTLTTLGLCTFINIQKWVGY